MLVKASNTTPRTLLGINLQIRLTDPLGSVNLYTQRLASIPANRSLQFDTQLRPGSGRVAVSVVASRPSLFNPSSLRRHMCAGLMLLQLRHPLGISLQRLGCLKIMISTPQVHQTNTISE